MTSLVVGRDPVLTGACAERIGASGGAVEYSIDLANAAHDPDETASVVLISPMPIGLGGSGHREWFGDLEHGLGSVVSGMGARGGGRLVLVVHTASPVDTDGTHVGVSTTAAAVASVLQIARSAGRHRVSANIVRVGLLDHPLLHEATARDAELAGRLDRLIDGTPLRRLVTPAEVAAAVAFLTSTEASYVDGAVLPVDGGLAIGRGI